jgi:hypothetical protein
MGSNWETTTIADCAADVSYSTQIGPFGNKVKAEIYTAFGAPVLRGVNVNRGRFHDEDFVFVSEEYAREELKKFEARATIFCSFIRARSDKSASYPRTVDITDTSWETA